MRVSKIVRALPIAFAILPCWAAVSDPPDSAINLTTGHIEIVDTIVTATGLDVRHVTNTGEGEPRVVKLTQDPLDDLDPKLTVDPQGDTWVVWWRDGDTDRVLFRRKSRATGQWDQERRVGDDAENSRSPSVVADDAGVHVAYEIDSGSTTTIAVCSINEEPDPIPFRETIASTSYTGDVDVRVHASSGALWITWIDGPDEVGWAEYDAATATWSLPAYEPCAADDVAAARSRIQARVTGG